MIYSSDSETFLIQPGCQAPPMVCWQFALDEAEPEIVHIQDPACYREIRAMVEGRALLQMQNAAYDVAVVMAQYPDLITPLFDKYDRDEVTCTIVRQKLFDIARGRFKARSKQGYALDQIARYHNLNLGLDKADPWRMRYGELLHLPVAHWPREAREYALKDVHAQRLIFGAQEHYRMSRGIPLDDQFRQSRAALWLHLMACRGLMVDPVRTEEYMHTVAATLCEDRDALLATGLVKPDGVKDTKRAMTLMAELCLENEDPIPLTETGEAKARALLGLQDDGDLSPAHTWRYWEAIRHDRKQISGIKLDEDSVILYGDEQLEAYQRYSTSTTQLARALRLFLAARAGVPIQSKFGSLVDSGRTSCSQGDGRRGMEDNKAPSAYGFQIQNPAKDKVVKRKCPDGWVEGKDVHTNPLTGDTVPAWFLRKGPRELFVSREGFTLCSTDYGSMELCAVAWVCLRTVGHSRLAEVLNAGRDPHTELGALLAGISAEEAYARMEGLRGAELQKEFKERFRQLAKIANFGFWGGMGPKKLALQARKQYGVVLGKQHEGHHPTAQETLAAAQALHAAFKQMWPEFKAFCKWGSSKLSGPRGEELGEVTQFVSKRRRGRLWFSALLNTMFQGFAADIKKAACWRIAREMYTGMCWDDTSKPSPLAGCFLVNDVHDEPLTELRLEVMHEAGLRVAEIQVQTAREWGPEVKWTCEPAFMTRWFKAAEAIEHLGKLVPWDAFKHDKKKCNKKSCIHTCEPVLVDLLEAIAA